MGHFCVGTFSDISDMNIAMVMAPGFLHRMDQDSVIEGFSSLSKNNNVERILVDSVTSPPYQYGHNFEELFKTIGYELEYRSQGIAAVDFSRRHILIFRKLI